jgi:hypothetical protein
MEIPKFGGGSSFSNNPDIQSLKGNVFERWKNYSNNEFYKSIFRDKELVDLTLKLFNTTIDTHSILKWARN